MLNPFLHLFALPIGLVALLIGAGAVIFPRRASEGYGLPATGEGIPYVRATGVRDVFLGFTFLVLAHHGNWRAIGYLSLVGALVACVDGWLVKTGGRSRLWLIHACGAVILAAYSLALLAGPAR